MKISIRQVYGDSPVVDHNRLSYCLDCLHLERLFLSLYIGLVKTELLLDVTFHSFLVQEIVGSKSQEFPDLVLFPLPVPGEEFRSLLEVTVKKIGSALSELAIGYPETVFNFSHCPTKRANLPPTGMSGRGKPGNGNGWLSELCGRGGKFRGGELFGATTPLEESLSGT